MKKVLAVAVHPDDETLGCGGALLKHKKNGDEIYWLIITSVGVENGWEQNKAESRRREIDKNKYRIWKAMPCDNISELEDESPGNHIFENNSGLPIVKCRDKCINILDYEEI